MYSRKIIFKRITQAPIALLGLVIVKFPVFNKYKLHLLSTWLDVDKRSRLDNFLFKYVLELWFRFEYLREPNPDKREILKSLAMGGNSGENWAKFYQNKKDLGSLSPEEVSSIFDDICTILDKTEFNYLVIQIGSSSGREIAYLANKFPKHEFIGTDIYDEVVKYSSQYHDYPNLSFVKSPANEVGSLINRFNISLTSKPVIIFSSGSLQYVQPEHVTIFFNALSNHRNLKVLLLEPGDDSKGEPDSLKASLWRNSFSYTHDYQWYAQNSGIETVKCEITKPYPYDDPIHKNTAHYFYYGKTK